MIKTKEARELEQRFSEIKKTAEKKQKSLPSDLKPDEIDEGIFYALLYLFLTFRYGAYTEEEYELRVKKLLPKYKTRKAMRKRQFEMYQQDQERYKRSSVIADALLTKDLGYKEEFNLLFEYIETLSNPVTAKKLKKRIGYSLITGCKNFTEEEFEVLEKEYSTLRGKERKNSA